MKLLRYRDGKNIVPGILDDDNKVRNASNWVKDWDSETIRNENLDEIKLKDTSSLPLATEFSLENDKIDLAPCISKKSVGKLFLVAQNYQLRYLPLNLLKKLNLLKYF